MSPDQNTQDPIVTQDPDVYIPENQDNSVSAENATTENDPEILKYQKLIQMEVIRKTRIETKKAYFTLKELNDLTERPDKITFSWKLIHVLKVFLSTSFWTSKDGATFGLPVLAGFIITAYLLANGHITEAQIPIFLVILSWISQIGSIWAARAEVYNVSMPSIPGVSYLPEFTTKTE